MEYITNSEKELSENAIKEDRMVLIKGFITGIMKSLKIVTKKKLLEEVSLRVSPRCNPAVELIQECIDYYVAEEIIEHKNKKDTFKLVPKSRQRLDTE